jgi:hypothetical protein
MDEMNPTPNKKNKKNNNKYASLLFYAIHLYFITLFEVLFYLYYILPYEQQLLFGLFEFHSDQLTAKYNITITASDLYDTEHCRDDTDRIRRANTPLYLYCYYYIGVVSVCFVGLFCYDVSLHLMKNADANLVSTKIKTITTPTTNGLTKNTFSFSSVDMQEVELGTMGENKTAKDIKTEKSVDPPSASEKQSNYWKESMFIAEFIRSLYFICFIGVFEYLFFTQIVDNFKVFDLKMILCNLLK